MKILLIEDNEAQAEYAQIALADAGLESTTVVTLSEALDVMPEYDAVLSDLFFPAGMPTEEFSELFSPLYAEFKEQRYSGGMVGRAVQQCASLFGMTSHDYIENVIAKTNNPAGTLEAARKSQEGRSSAKYQKFLEIEENIRNGTNLPLGIVATGMAMKQGIPAVIVTSTYHHDDAFEAVRTLIKVPYKDTLIEGRKDWENGIELLLR
jgi:CheY-like chemotaxis protein